MDEINSYLGAKSFDDYIPILLQDKGIQNLLKKALKHLNFQKVIKVKKGDQNFDDIKWKIYDHFLENAEWVEQINLELDLENPDRDPENEIFINIRKMGGVFLTESYEDDVRFFDSFEKAIKSIELNYDIELDKNFKLLKSSLGDRMSTDEAIQKVIDITKKPKI